MAGGGATSSQEEHERMEIRSENVRRKGVSEKKRGRIVTLMGADGTVDDKNVREASDILKWPLKSTKKYMQSLFYHGLHSKPRSRGCARWRVSSVPMRLYLSR